MWPELAKTRLQPRFVHHGHDDRIRHPVLVGNTLPEIRQKLRGLSNSAGGQHEKLVHGKAAGLGKLLDTNFRNTSKFSFLSLYHMNK